MQEEKNNLCVGRGYKCSNKELKSPRNMLLSGVFAIIWGLVKYIPSPVGDYFRYPVLKIFCKEFHTTYIGENITLWFPWNICIEEHVSLNNGIILDGTGGIRIGSDSRIAAGVGFHTADHGFDDPEVLIREQGFVVAPIIIGKDVWIGAGTNLTKGVRIGEGSVIGCGSVVTKDVEPYSIAAGNPCKFIRKRNGGGN